MMVPPEYREEFHPNVLVRNWQGIPLENKREDWIAEGEVPLEEGRFIPQSVLRALQRRARQDPNAPIRRLFGGWRDLVVINDEAHHVYGEKRGRKGEEAEYIKWSKILERIGKAARVSLVVDLSATPWYGSGSPKPEGTLFEWLVATSRYTTPSSPGSSRLCGSRPGRGWPQFLGPVGSGQGTQGRRRK